MPINDIINDSWGPYSHTEVEAALKAKIAELDQKINDAIHEGGIGLDELSAEVRALLTKANNALQPSDISAWAKQPNKPSYSVGEISYDGTMTLAQKLTAMDTAIQNAIQVDTAMSGSSTNPVQNKVIKSYVDDLISNLQGVLNTITQDGATAGVIDTFNEVKAFLAGISNSDTLAAKLLNKVDKENGKGLSTNDYTDAEKTKLGALPTNAELTKALGEKANTADIPTNVSDLTNDSGFITSAALEGIVAGAADFVLTEDDDAFYLTRLVPTLVVTELAAMSESTKSGTFKVSGTNLKGNVTVSVSASGWTLQTGGGSASQSLTLSPTDGTLAETTITVAYSGSTDSVGNAITIASTGAESKSVNATYTEHSGPTITTSGDGISISEVAGDQKTTTLQITGVMLTADITAALSGTNASKFSLSKSTFTQSNGVVNETLTITYSPAAGDSGTHSATLTLSSTDATPVTIALTGTVLVQSLSLSPSTLELSSASGTSTTGTITVKGANLKSDVALSVGSGYSVSPSTIAYATLNAAGNTGVDVTITADTTAASGTLTATSGSNSATASLSWVETEVETQDAFYVKGGIHYKLTSLENKTVKVVNSFNTETGTNNNYPGKSTITIPATVHIGENDYKVTSIAGAAFAKCSASTIDMSAAIYISSIAGFASNACSSLSTLKLPPNLTAIGDYAFQNATALTSVTLPDKLTSIGNYAFMGCSNLTSVYFGTTDNIVSTSSLNLFAFYNVTSITDIYLRYNGSNVQDVTNDFNATVKSNSTLHVPTNATSAFTASTTYWGAWVTNNKISFDLTPTE